MKSINGCEGEPLAKRCKVDAAPVTVPISESAITGSGEPQDVCSDKNDFSNQKAIDSGNSSINKVCVICAYLHGMTASDIYRSSVDLCFETGQCHNPT